MGDTPEFWDRWALGTAHTECVETSKCHNNSNYRESGSARRLSARMNAPYLTYLDESLTLYTCLPRIWRAVPLHRTSPKNAASHTSAPMHTKDDDWCLLVLKPIHKTIQLILVRNTRQDRDKSEERKRRKDARTDRQFLRLQMRASQTGEKKV